MKANNSIVIKEQNLSVAWSRAFLALIEEGMKEIVPLQVTINGIGDETALEIPQIRQMLDRDLQSKKLPTCETISSTIFPISMWNPLLHREALFNRYFKALPQLRKCKANANGIYFERLVKYGETDLNQLDFFLTSRNEKHNNRRSVLQAALVDPKKDLTNQPRRGFPCLQQVSFAPFGKNELAVNGFYGTQHIYKKAYGNYLGLLNLGKFVAHELGLRLTQVSCFTGIAQLGAAKKEVIQIAKGVEKLLRTLPE
jgi:hypothetical protein